MRKNRQTTDSGDGGRRKPRHRLATLLVSTLLSLGVLAGVLTLLRSRDSDDSPRSPYAPTLVDQHGRSLSVRRGNLRLMLDPYSVYRNQPDQRTEAFTIDARGHRATPARPEARKIVMLGGSTLFGFGLPSDETTFSWLLGERFSDLEVVNAGVIGYLSGEELATMVHRFDRDEAVAYVIFDGWNELLDQLYFRRRHDYEFGFNNQFFSLQERLHQRFAEESGRDAVPPPPPPPEDDGYFDRLSAAYEQNLDRMHAVALGRGARVLVVLQPELGSKRLRTGGEEEALSRAFELHEGYETFPVRYAAFRARVRGFCDQRGIPVVDLVEEPAVRDASSELFYDEVHLNVEGNRIVARILGDELSELLDR